MATDETVQAEQASAITAEIATNAPANAALILCGVGSLFGPQKLVPLLDSVNALVAQVKSGDLAVIDEMLLSQAVALQGVFTNLTHRAATQSNPRLLQTQLGLALRAQGQARATLEALVHLKQPSSPTFIGQANIATQQQVNNRFTHPPGTTAIGSFDQNKLLEARDEQRLDSGAPSAAAQVNSDLATLGTVNRPEVC